ncbi:MAG: 50S ribosome-binding GTPase, partial [Lachnospiraceae bacterium]|nr:50S ribosome-binding GTPase [Lachnospiraceae bacterium]
MTLNELKSGESAVITKVGGEGALRQHFLDMGVIPKTEVTLIKLAPMGDPMELRIHGYELTLRLADAEKIEIEPVCHAEECDHKNECAVCPKKAEGDGADGERAGVAGTGNPGRTSHPGFGEDGVLYHDPATEHPLPEGPVLTFALAGNQNSGKTTLFNSLTGSNQHVGNFPGVTVDRKSGAIRGHADTEVVDLPGIYSLSPYTEEEIVSRQYIIGEKPKGIINIVDATNIERNLYLTMQLIELDVPMVLALNMMDELRGNGGSVRTNDMEAMLGIPVVPISAA